MTDKLIIIHRQRGAFEAYDRASPSFLVILLGPYAHIICLFCLQSAPFTNVIIINNIVFHPKNVR